MSWIAWVLNEINFFPPGAVEFFGCKGLTGAKIETVFLQNYTHSSDLEG